MSTDKQLITSSFGTCCLSPRFFDDFYDTFTAASPRIREKFTNTDMAKQRQLLREGITFMIMFNDGGAMAEQKVRGLGASHSEQRMNIDPALYSLWLDALLATIAKHDKNFSPELDKAWRRVLGKGIEVMRSMYKAPQPALV